MTKTGCREHGTKRSIVRGGWIFGGVTGLAATAAGTWLVTRRPSGETVDRELPRQDVEATRQHFEKAAKTLKRSIRRNRRVALVAGIIGVVAVGAGVAIGGWTTKTGTDAMVASHYKPAMLVFELVRSAGAAALVAAFVWGMLNLARAALDQSTRYEKRYVAGHFLVYVLDKFEREIKDQRIEVTEMMSVFKAWNDSVDSAYTHVKFGSKQNQAFTLAASSQGFSLGAGGATAPKTLPSTEETPGKAKRSSGWFPVTR